MNLDRNFSENAISLMAESRKIAVELGYDYISTLHLLLADCKLNYQYSIRNFIFHNDTEFDTFMGQHKIGDVSIFAETIPITKEAEQTIFKGCLLWSDSIYYDDEIRPYHFFLAASQLPETDFCLLLEPKKGLHERLERYYLQIGQIDQKNISKSLWSRFSKKLFSK